MHISKFSTSSCSFFHDVSPRASNWLKDSNNFSQLRCWDMETFCIFAEKILGV